MSISCKLEKKLHVNGICAFVKYVYTHTYMFGRCTSALHICVISCKLWCRVAIFHLTSYFPNKKVGDNPRHTVVVPGNVCIQYLSKLTNYGNKYHLNS